MSGTVLEHPIVRVYLYRLDGAMRGLPAAQYRELRDQIAAHLDDVLPAGADDAQIAAALSRLGTPADLAADAKAQFGPTIREVLAAGARRKWARVTGARRRTKVLAAVIVLGLVTGGTYLGLILTAPLIQTDGEATWWYPQDAGREVWASADGAQQVTVPIRSGQRQGFAFGIYNPSNFTETVVGPVMLAHMPLDGYDSPDGFGPVQMGVSVPDREIAHGGMIRNVAFMLPASIPPHQYRILLITWISKICLEGKGSATVLDRLYVRVRVGWFTRTDIIPLGMGWGLSGPSHNPDTRPGPNYNMCV
jgi:hypothetical protein